MSKTFRFDPEEDFGGDNLPTMSKKDLKAARKERKRNDLALDEHMQPETDSEYGR